MPFNETIEEAEAQGATDLLKKLRLEEIATQEHRELFEAMAEDLLAFVSATGRPPSAQMYSDDLRGLLSQQSRRAMSSFRGTLLDEIEEQEEDDDVIVWLFSLAEAMGTTAPGLLGMMRSQAAVAASEAVRLRVDRDTRLITNTNQAELDKAVRDAAIALAVDGQGATNPELAALATGLFLDRAVGRAGTIAATTTQWAAEEAKEIELRTFNDTAKGFPALAAGIIAPEIEVVWVTMEDDLVRAAHEEAHGQVRGQDGVFIVMNQALRVPGDTTLGATAENVINCRCGAVFRMRALPLAA